MTGYNWAVNQWINKNKDTYYIPTRVLQFSMIPMKSPLSYILIPPESLLSFLN